MARMVILGMAWNQRRSVWPAVHAIPVAIMGSVRPLPLSVPQLTVQLVMPLALPLSVSCPQVEVHDVDVSCPYVQKKRTYGEKNVNGP